MVNQTQVTAEQAGVGSGILVPVASGSPITILSGSINQSGTQSETRIFCGSHTLFKSYTAGVGSQNIQYKCSHSLEYTKTGAGDTAFISVSYVPYQVGLTATNSIGVDNTMTAGDLDIILLLFGLVMLSLLNLFFKKV